MKKQKSTYQYYPAVLYGGFVWVAPTGITKEAAKDILMMNNSSIGVFAISNSYARRLCSGLGGAIGPKNHGSKSGY